MCRSRAHHDSHGSRRGAAARRRRLRSETIPPLRFAFTDIAARAGLTARTVYGGEGSNRYLFETTGSGAAAFDADGDGWIDIFLVNGSTLEGFRPGRRRPAISIATGTTAPSRT